jgi:hypothetical protein
MLLLARVTQVQITQLMVVALTISFFWFNRFLMKHNGQYNKRDQPIGGYDLLYILSLLLIIACINVLITIVFRREGFMDYFPFSFNF